MEARPSSTRPSYGTVDREYAMRLATSEGDDPIWMVNLMAYRDVASYADGNPDGITGREADDRYAPLDVLADIGAEVVFAGDVDTQLLGDAPRWDRIGVVRYPSRRSFIEMQARGDFQERHVHKEAGLASTIVMGCLPADVPLDEHGLSNRDWSTVPHPPTADDGPVVVVHVIRYVEGAGRDTMVGYQDKASVVAGRHGARVGGWFDVEGTIVGDGRAWDQVRFNIFPSKAAFMAVVADPDRLAAQREHREVAIADTYTMIVRPIIDLMGGSI